MNASVEAMFRRLWSTLLNTDDGIDGVAYESLRNLGMVACPGFTVAASRKVDATDGRFYVSGKRWRIRSVYAIDDETGKPLEWSNDLGWVKAGFGDEFEGRDGFNLPMSAEWFEE